MREKACRESLCALPDCWGRAVGRDGESEWCTIYHCQPVYSITKGAWWIHFTGLHTSLSAARH